MKLKLAIISLVLFGFTACTQKTCPTYAKVDVQDSKVEVEADV